MVDNDTRPTVDDALAKGMALPAKSTWTGRSRPLGVGEDSGDGATAEPSAKGCDAVTKGVG
jgi:hypothetical protein